MPISASSPNGAYLRRQREILIARAREEEEEVEAAQQRDVRHDSAHDLEETFRQVQEEADKVRAERMREYKDMIRETE